MSAVPCTEHNGHRSDYMNRREDIRIGIELIKFTQKSSKNIIPFKCPWTKLLAVRKKYVNQHCKGICHNNEPHQFLKGFRIKQKYSGRAKLTFKCREFAATPSRKR